MKKFLLLTAIACTATVSAVAPAMSQTAIVIGGNNVTVNSTVAASCKAPTASTASVSGYDGTADVTANSTVSFKCTKSTVGTVVLGVPTSLTSTTTVDTLTATVAFPNGEDGKRTGTGLSGTGATNVLTVPAVVTVAAGQDVTPAAYTGSIPVSVSY